MGRSTQGVIVMRLREGELVSSLAPVVESGDDAAAADDTAPAEPVLEPEPTPLGRAVAPFSAPARSHSFGHICRTPSLFQIGGL